MGNFGRNLFIWSLILLVIFGIASTLSAPESRGNRIDFSEFQTRVARGEVEEVTISGRHINGVLESGIPFATYAPDYPNLVADLNQAEVRIKAEPDDQNSPSLLSIIISVFPFLLFIGVYIYFMRQMQGGGGRGGALGFGKSRARLLNERTGRVTFEDVAGVEEAKEELHEIVEFLKAPQKFQKLGGKIPKGCLLVGPPGTGKTLLARAIAGEAEVPFFTISGSDFVEMFVGVGASRVRDMFEQGKKHAPCLIFIDEIDAVGRHRGAGLGGGNDEREQTLNQLLVEMDGFESNEGVILIAATNRPDVLDPALLRPGRFDRQIVVPNPDIKGRAQILEVHLKKVPIAPDVEPRTIARGTPGFSGADLANLVNEAALLAARRDRKVVTMEELEEAKDKVMMGRERRSMVMSEEEKKLTAYHEAGHAVVGLHSPASDPIHKATIIPRGQALGMVMRLPEEDQLSITREKVHSDIAVAMGGRVAEEIIFGYDKVTSGASSDIKQATKLARAMVTQWGMCDDIGPVYYGNDNHEVFLGATIGQADHVSPAIKNKIDDEVRRIVEAGLAEATRILEEFNEELHILAEALLEYETLSGDEIRALLAGEPIRQNEDENGGAADVEGRKRKRTSVPTAGHRPEAAASPVDIRAEETEDPVSVSPPKDAE